MSEDKTKETSAPVEAKEEVQEETKQEIKSFNQEQLDNIVQTRIMAERRKYEKKKIREQQNLQKPSHYTRLDKTSQYVCDDTRSVVALW